MTPPTPPRPPNFGAEHFSWIPSQAVMLLVSPLLVLLNGLG